MNISTLRQNSKAIVFVVIMVVTTLLATLFLKTNFDNRQQASTLTGTAQFTFQSQTGTTLKPGSTEAIVISASGTGASNVDGFQLIANITGTVPTMTLEPTQFTQLNSVASSISDTTTGKKLTLAFITKDPQTPFNPNNAVIPLATLRFTVPASGSMSIMVDENYSKVLQSVTGGNLLGVSPAGTFTFANPASPSLLPSPIASPIVASPSPVASPIVLSPSPTIRPSATPTTQPTIRPTPSPIPSPVPSPTPVASGSPVSCSNKNLKVTPYPDSTKWTTTGQFQVQNTGSTPIQFNWSLNAFSAASSNLNQKGTKILGPKESVVLGLGNICSRWSLNLGCSKSGNDRGYVVESNSAACVTTSPAASATGTTQSPSSTATTNQNVFQKFFDSVKNLFKR